VRGTNSKRGRPAPPPRAGGYMTDRDDARDDEQLFVQDARDIARDDA
jgi:hypothetical protein